MGVVKVRDVRAGWFCRGRVAGGVIGNVDERGGTRSLKIAAPTHSSPAAIYSCGVALPDSKLGKEQLTVYRFVFLI